MHSYLFCILLVCPCCHAESNLSTRSLFREREFASYAVILSCVRLCINLSYREILNSAKIPPYQAINYITHFQHALDMTILRKDHLNVRISFVSAYAYDEVDEVHVFCLLFFQLIWIRLLCIRVMNNNNNQLCLMYEIQFELLWTRAESWRKKRDKRDTNAWLLIQ